MTTTLNVVELLSSHLLPSEPSWKVRAVFFGSGDVVELLRCTTYQFEPMGSLQLGATQAIYIASLSQRNIVR